MLKVDIPAIPFARAYEAVILASGSDAKRPVTYRSVSVEHFEDKGLRLISSDGYLAARAWVPFDEVDGESEPSIGVTPDEQFIVVDSDHRGLGLLKHARKQFKKEWAFKAKQENPDTSPKLRLEVRTPHRTQGVLEGMDLPLFMIDYPEHEIVSLAILQSNFVEWRALSTGTESPIPSLRVAAPQLTSISKIARLYDGHAAEWSFHGEADTVAVTIGPINVVMKTAEAVEADKEQKAADERQARLDEDEAAYDEDEDDA